MKLTYHSPAGEGGYPGNMTVQVTYSLSDEGTLSIVYRAESDDDTICNLTNHTYFNLDGEGAGDVLAQTIEIDADTFTWADEESLPDGRILPVEGTPMDLRQPVAIGAHIDDDYDELRMAGGYDHNWVLGEPEADGLRKAAVAHSDKTGFTLTCRTTQPGLQFYTGNHLDHVAGKNGHVYDRRDGFCLETQFFPNAPANPDFPQPVLKKGDVWKAETQFNLSVTE